MPRDEAATEALDRVAAGPAAPLAGRDVRLDLEPGELTERDAR